MNQIWLSFSPNPHTCSSTYMPPTKHLPFPWWQPCLCWIQLQSSKQFYNTSSQVFTLLLLVGAPLGCCEIAPKIWPKWLYLFYFFKLGLESYKDRNPVISFPCLDLVTQQLRLIYNSMLCHLSWVIEKIKFNDTWCRSRIQGESS